MDSASQRVLALAAMGTDAARWEMVDVTGQVSLSAAIARTYREQADLRVLVQRIHASAPIATAADVGCGFGRFLPVLGEFTPNVTGYERESGLAAEAARLWPAATVVSVATLADLPAGDAAFDLLLTFTVLQHLDDPLAQAVCRELARLRRPTGSIVVCEETDPNLLYRSPTGHMAIGRPIETYARWLAPLPLRDRAPRRIEPNYPRSDVGSFLVFGP